MRVKICGVTNPDDARLAAACGADAVGVLVGQRHPSRDFVSVDEAVEIFAALPPYVAATLVTHEEDPAVAAGLIDAVRPHVAQIHSEMPPADCAMLRSRLRGTKIVKSYHVTGPESVDYGSRYADVVDGFVLDSTNRTTGQVGGTGLPHDWNVSAAIVRRYPLPFMLAGGLTPENVAAAIALVRPFGVDVNSGVGAAVAGRKDPGRVRELVRRAKVAGEAIGR